MLDDAAYRTCPELRVVAFLADPFNCSGRIVKLDAIDLQEAGRAVELDADDLVDLAATQRGEDDGLIDTVEELWTDRLLQKAEYQLTRLIDSSLLTARGRVAELLKDGWNTLYPINTYRESTADAVPYEQPWDKDGKFPATLPLNTAELAKVKGPGVIRTTPMGNTLTFEMAKAAIEGESLGARTDETDFLAMSHSATDYVGHRYGTFAVETEDTYLRLDKDLADFLSYLDGRFGRDGYLFVLTADHAAAHNIAFDRDHKLPGDVFRSDLARQIADSAARAYIGRDAQVIRAYMNYQIFFRQGLIDSLGINRQGLYHAICKAVKDKLPGVAYAVPAEEVATATVPDVVKTRIINGYRKGRSGDIFLVPDPGWYSKSGTSLPQGTTHGVWSPYDTHIPLIFMGHGVRAGHLYRETYITDIAATLAALLKTQYPSGCIGHPITEAFVPAAPAAAPASSASHRR